MYQIMYHGIVIDALKVNEYKQGGETWLVLVDNNGTVHRRREIDVQNLSESPMTLRKISTSKMKYRIL